MSATVGCSTTCRLRSPAGGGCRCSAPAALGKTQPAAGDGRSGARHPRRSGRQRWATDSGPSGVDGARKICSTHWLSVRDNVALGVRLRGEKVDRARVAALLEQVELSSCADARPATLSGGMRQRAALARTRCMRIAPSCCWMSLSRRWIPSPVRGFRPWRPPCWPVARWCLSPTIRRRPAG